MTARWLLTDYAHTWVGDELHVWHASDILVHSFLRWTQVEERVHLHGLITRGLALPKDPKYCFVEWLEVEQSEPGDTLTHTFEFPSWST